MVLEQTKQRTVVLSNDSSAEKPSGRFENKIGPSILRHSVSEAQISKNQNIGDSPLSLEPIKSKESQKSESTETSKTKLPSYLTPTYAALQLKKAKLENAGEKQRFSFGRRKTKVLDYLDWNIKQQQLLLERKSNRNTRINIIGRFQ